MYDAPCANGADPDDRDQLCSFHRAARERARQRPCLSGAPCGNEAEAGDRDQLCAFHRDLRTLASWRRRLWVVALPLGLLTYLIGVIGSGRFDERYMIASSPPLGTLAGRVIEDLLQAALVGGLAAVGWAAVIIFVGPAYGWIATGRRGPDLW